MKNAFFTMLLMLALFAGCATFPSDQSEESSLRKRVDGYMQANIAEKWDVAYTFFDASYQRAVSKDQFIYKPRNVKIKSYAIESLKIFPSGKEAEVRQKLEIQFQGYTFPNAPQKQIWIKEGGKWHLKEKLKRSMPFSSSQTTSK